MVWFQGCNLACRGCFNPESHDPSAGSEIEVARLVDEILDDATALEGVTISGGEPLQQPEALLALLTGLRGSGLSTLVFSGYRLDEIGRGPVGRACLDQMDLLIAVTDTERCSGPWQSAVAMPNVVAGLPVPSSSSS